MGVADVTLQRAVVVVGPAVPAVEGMAMGVPDVTVESGVVVVGPAVPVVMAVEDAVVVDIAGTEAQGDITAEARVVVVAVISILNELLLDIAICGNKL